MFTSIRPIKAEEYIQMIENIIDSIDIDYKDLYKKYFIKHLVTDREYPYTGPTDLDIWIKKCIDDMIVLTPKDNCYKQIKNDYDNEYYCNDICTYNGETHLILIEYDNCFLLTPY